MKGSEMSAGEPSSPEEVAAWNKQHARDIVDGGHDASCIQAKADAYKLCAQLEDELERAASGNATLRAELNRVTEENDRLKSMDMHSECRKREAVLTRENETYQDVVQFTHSKALTAIKAALKQARELRRTLQEWQDADQDTIARTSTGWQTPEAAARTERLIKAKAAVSRALRCSLCQGPCQQPGVHYR
jgi:hypothetical protein